MLELFKLNMSLAGVLLSALILLACSKDSENEIIDKIPEQDVVSFNYLALGDSYTIGTGLVDEDEKYPVQLVERLNSSPFLNGSDPRVIARNGVDNRKLVICY